MPIQNTDDDLSHLLILINTVSLLKLMLRQFITEIGLQLMHRHVLGKLSPRHREGKLYMK